MIKKFFVLVLLIIFSIPVFGETIKGGISYTEEEARALAFEGVKIKLPQRMVKANQIDPFFDENKAQIEKGEKEIDLGDRVIQVFPDGKYLIWYKKYDKYLFGYDSIGKLYAILKNYGDEFVFPFKGVTYDTKGNIMFLMFMPSKDATYVFDSNKKLIKVDRR